MTYTHGMRNTPLYAIWCAIIQRCTNPNDPAYPNYGGRGITICDQWRHDFVAFRDHVGDPPPDLTLDRIDNDRGYEPGNVRWATRAEQNRNRRAHVHPQARKTHCPAGHPYDEANTYVVPKTGHRLCRACARERDRLRRPRQTRPSKKTQENA